jgi:hypothetical protein
MGRKKTGRNIVCEQCKKVFYTPKCVDRIYCSILCSSEASKFKRIGENNPAWKGEEGKYAYSNLHKSIKKKCGKANLCRNEICNGGSKNFEWANVTGIYTRDSKNYRELCKSCHINFDRYKRPLKIKGLVICKIDKLILFNDYTNKK